MSLSTMQSLFFHPPLKTLYMRHLALLFLAFSWDQPVVSSHCKLASAQERFMGLCVFRWNMLMCSAVFVCRGRRRGAGHSQRASWHLPNTIWILNAGGYAPVAVDIVLSLSFCIGWQPTDYRLMMDTEHIPPSSAVIQPCTCLLHISSPHWS